MTPLQKKRLSYKPILPNILKDLSQVYVKTGNIFEIKGKHAAALKELFPRTYNQPLLHVEPMGQKSERRPLKVGVVFSGGQASGGHNVISGLYDALKRLHSESRLLGFVNGPKGFIENQFIEISKEMIDTYRNQGGFDIIGSGRDKIETEEQFQKSKRTAKEHDLDGFVIIGGDDSNTNAALLAEFFLANEISCRVVGVPKTIDGDLKNEYVDISFGFDTATKTYSEIIGNIARDALSQKKYYFLIKLMGRSASHITLECAMKTHPNLAYIGEEIAKEAKTFRDLINGLADLIVERSESGKNYGVILIPEGVIEFIPEFKTLISELNSLLSPEKNHQKFLERVDSHQEKIQYVSKQLSSKSLACFESIPKTIQVELLLKRDAHGNVPVSKIETEKMFIEAVEEELKQRKRAGKYSGKFSAQPFFCGYEGRSAFPTNFDCQYCYALGFASALLIDAKATGYMSSVTKLYSSSPEEWGLMGIPLIPLMNIEERHGRAKPVIKKALVDLNSDLFLTFKKERGHWSVEDDYQYPGPIQFD